MFEDIRSLIRYFEEKNDLIRIKREVDPRFELAATVSYTHLTLPTKRIV